MASELARVANSAFRSSPVTFRTATSINTSRMGSCLSIVTPSPICSERRNFSNAAALVTSMHKPVVSIRTSASISQKRSESSWANPSRSSRPPGSYDDTIISKPSGPSSSAADSSTSPASSSASSLKSSYSWPSSQRPNPSATSGGRSTAAGPTPIQGHSYSDDDYDFVDTMQFGLGELSKSRPAFDQGPERPRPSIRCVARTGRTVQVNKGADAARAFKLLNIECSFNRVRQDFQFQRYHERPGLKRKRLKSDRWQRRFKAGFKATCSRVTELRKQGW